MKKIIHISILVIITNVFVNYAQPRLTLQLMGGYSMPMPELKGDLPTDSANFIIYDLNKDGYSNTYYMLGGFNFGLIGKLGFGKKAGIRLTIGGGYKKFLNSEEITFSSGKTEVKPSIKVINFLIGGEYAFRTGAMFSPYIGLEFTGNSISGEETRTVTSASGSSVDSTWNLETSMRYGLGIGAGLDISFLRYFGINLSVKYNMVNVFGKDANSSVEPWTSFEQPLNDKEYTKNNVSYSAKNITDLQFNLGISLFFLHIK